MNALLDCDATDVMASDQAAIVPVPPCQHCGSLFLVAYEWTDDGGIRVRPVCSCYHPTRRT